MKSAVKQQIADRVRTAVSTELDRLAKTYGFPAVRAAANRYLKIAQTRAKARKEIARLEDELDRLKMKV